jgi:hypothetical protein
MMRRLLGVALIVAAAAAAARTLSRRFDHVASSGNGHAADEQRIALLRERIGAARRRLQDEIDSVRGE